MTIETPVIFLEGADAARVMQMVSTRLRYARHYWKPLHQRQDYWMSMFTLLDTIQQSKPLGYRRFISNEPKTSVEAAQAILTRNETRWRIDLTREETEGDEERRIVGKIERTLSGIIYDVDEMFSMRGEMPFWKRIAMQALLRGWIWAKVHVTTEALNYRESPLIADVYDSRTVYPLFDQYGLNCVIIERLCTLGELVMLYPDRFGEYELKKEYNQWTPAVKVEYWSNSRGNQPGITCTIATVGEAAREANYHLLETPLGAGSRWVIPPYEHGYPPAALPIVGVPVNGVNIEAKPALTGVLEQRLSERADLMAMQLLSWHGPGTWVADTGRSILSSVEEQMPQYNELIATIFQHFTIGTYGTWVFKTPTGEIPEWEGGIEAKIALRPEEDAKRYEPTPINADAYRLVDILTSEREKGTLSAILHAVGPFQGTGVLFQQITNSALNALEPYVDGMKQFGTRMGGSILKQMQLAAKELRPFEVSTPTAKASYFRIEFNPKTDLDSHRRYRAVPVMKPALPDDLTVRLTAARMALDPRRPMLSLVTVLEQILQQEDPEGEVDRIWEDMASMDPVLMADQLADAMERLGEPEMSARMREQEFRMKFVEDLKFRQMTGNIPGAPGGGAPGPGPETGEPSAARRTGEAEARAGVGVSEEGRRVMGEMGERLMT